MNLNLPYLSNEPDRHGNDRLYVRRHGRRVRLREPINSPGFLEAYRAALEGLRGDGTIERPVISAAPRGSLGWLAACYFGSPEFRALDPISQRTRRGSLEECFREPHRDNDPEPMRNCPLKFFSAAKIRRLRDLKSDKPGAANNRVKYIGSMLAWAVERGLLESNPCRDVRPIRYASSGFYTWTVEDVRRFEAKHPVGTKARLALALLLFTGVRRGDLVGLGRQHVREGWLRFVPRKTRYKRHRLSEKPIIPALAESIAQSPTGDLTFLVNEHGRPFTADSFSAWFRKRCNEAGLPQCTAHGLRKAAAVTMAEAGATDRQLMACFDWTSANQATRYTEAANRKKLAGDGMKLLGGE